MKKLNLKTLQYNYTALQKQMCVWETFFTAFISLILHKQVSKN